MIPELRAWDSKCDCLSMIVLCRSERLFLAREAMMTIHPQTKDDRECPQCSAREMSSSSAGFLSDRILACMLQNPPTCPYGPILSITPPSPYGRVILVPTADRLT
mmetsp:Transcript_85/g.193  ORF Transcript_85/g.193 Transcript_85/m.193 type:complete len:105 (+) Transcript_85:141-455(+)